MVKYICFVNHFSGIQSLSPVGSLDDSLGLLHYRLVFNTLRVPAAAPSVGANSVPDRVNCVL